MTDENVEVTCTSEEPLFPHCSVLWVKKDVGPELLDSAAKFSRQVLEYVDTNGLVKRDLPRPFLCVYGEPYPCCTEDATSNIRDSMVQPENVIPTEHVGSPKGLNYIQLDSDNVNPKMVVCILPESCKTEHERTRSNKSSNKQMDDRKWETMVNVFLVDNVCTQCGRNSYHSDEVEETKGQKHKTKSEDEDLATTMRSHEKKVISGLEENEAARGKASMLLMNQLKGEIADVQNKLKESEERLCNVLKECEVKTDQLRNAEDMLKRKEEEFSKMLEGFGRDIFENDQKIIEKRREETFKKMFKSSLVSPRTTETSQLHQDNEASTSAASMVTLEVRPSANVDVNPAVVEEIPQNDVVQATSVQESREESSSREGISLTNLPSTAVERSIYNNYKLLLLMISRNMLLSSDIMKLQEWARDIFSVIPSSDVHEVFLELDRKGVISASNMTRLREFFEKYQKIDVVHLIDCFLQGDYTYLQRSISSRKNNIPRSNYTHTTVPVGTFAVPVTTSTVPVTTSTVPVTAATVPVTTSAVPVATPVPKPRRSQMFGLFGGDRNAGKSEGSQGVKVEKSFTVNQTEAGNSPSKSRPTVTDCRTENSRGTSAKDVGRAGLVVTDGGAGNKYGTRSAAVTSVPIKTNGEHSRNQPSTTRHPEHHDGGSNGQKLSKFQRPDSAAKNRNPSPQDSDDDDDDDDEGNWLCKHYKRRCHVKFACCDKFWPCHRCHNNESNCGQKKLKSIHTKFVKCVKCGKEQQFGDGSQYCIQCNTKFASYFCAMCKHLTGKDDKPYHCKKCGICRIHKHRSFHCDPCGVCLDVQLRDNHKCREGSAHDECCICLEDAFSGCQILPCSHKVHKECATQMIRNGITRCPICRESFAHKLEKQSPVRPRSKHNGKK